MLTIRNYCSSNSTYPLGIKLYVYIKFIQTYSHHVAEPELSRSLKGMKQYSGDGSDKEDNKQHTSQVQTNEGTTNVDRV